MRFYYVYKALAHPEYNGYVVPFDLKERLMHVKEAERTLGSKIPWLCDGMDNATKHAFGNAPNSEFLIGPDGRILKKRLWSDPAELRKDLEEAVGKVEKPTRVADLKLKALPPPKAAARGVVKRLELPGSLWGLKLEPVVQKDGEPFYAKLRAEGEARLTTAGAGRLYLAFHLDPLYKVHWNNLTKPIRVTLHPPDGMKVETTTLTGPKVKEEADVDPREFLIDVRGADPKRPLKVSVSYFACNDEAGWCKPVSQEYLVHFAIDPDGGWALNRRPGAGKPGNRGARRARIVALDVKAGSVILMTPDGKQATYEFAANARLRSGPGRPTKLEDFRPGDAVMFRTRPGGKVPDTITGMMKRNPARQQKPE